MAQHRNIQYERAVPKFLQAYIKQHAPAFAADDSDGDSGDEQQRSAKAAARRKLEDRPDRDDEAPVVVGGDEYVSEIRHGLVEGIAAKQAAASSDAADFEHGLENQEDAEPILADPLASSSNNILKPVFVGGRSESSRLADALAEKIEAETGQHVYRKAAVKRPTGSGSAASSDAPPVKKDRKKEKAMSFNIEDE